MDLEGKILKYLPLAEGIAKRYDCDPDIKGVARLSLVEAVMKRPDLENCRMKSYIFKFVRGRILDFLAKRATVPIPNSLIRKEKELAWARKEHPDYKKLQSKYSFIEVPIKDEYELEYEDFYKHVSMTDVEIDVVTMRIMGYTQQEIGNKYKKSIGWCDSILKKLRQRCVSLGLWKESKRVRKGAT